MGSQISEVVILLISNLGFLLLLAILLRFLLQASRADFYNPVCQSLVRAIDPILKPLRKVIPAYKNFDFATLITALFISTIASAVMIWSAGYSLPNIGLLLSWCFLGLLSFILNIYFYGLIISIVASWIAPYSGNPVLLLVHQMLEPLQSNFRKIIPPMGGLDFSPIFIFLALRVVDILAIQSLAQGLGLGGQAAQFIIGI